MFVFYCHGKKETLVKLGVSAKPWIEGFPVSLGQREAFSSSEQSSEVCACLWKKRTWVVDLKIVFV